jgi:hypothetical protein
MNPCYDAEMDMAETLMAREDGNSADATSVYVRHNPFDYEIARVHKIPNSVFLNSVISYITVKRKRKSDVNVYTAATDAAVAATSKR